ncbi:hypothetical protein DY000_02023731 [Brassica cretica]|uniref:Uncharacterized protein n=1 Tax=Brassica cretica TaxID=69181 RepID=A0ABQ7ED39_BRACR|nr:hypothetical protein DY000_02023731 [Brassica cretica]
MSHIFFETIQPFRWSTVALIVPSLMDLATMLYASAIGCAKFSLSFWATSVREILEKCLKPLLDVTEL